MAAHNREELYWVEQSGMRLMTCDCCGQKLGWGGTSYEGHSLVCDYCAEHCYPELWAKRKEE